jgi:glycosyltransferase involved in cell wall biosynthesis
VLGLVTELRKHDVDISLFAGVPLINSGLVREKDFSRKMVSTARTIIKPSPLIVASTILPQNMMNWFSVRNIFNLMTIGGINKLKKTINNTAPDIIHCRSYYSVFAVIKTLEYLQIKPKIIFDARGLLPEEAAMKNNFDLSDPRYRMLKDVESYAAQSSDCVISVSETMRDTLDVSVGNTPHYLVYLHSNKSISSEVSLGPKNIVGLYVGALGESCWHSAEYFVEMAKWVRASFPTAQFVIAGPVSDTAQTYIKNNLPNDIVTFTSYTNEVARREIFAKCSFGMLPSSKPKNEAAKKVMTGILGTKSVEYLCDGLPVLVHESAGGAAAIVRKNNFGIIKSSKSPSVNKSELQLLLTNESRFEISKKATEMFSVETTCKNYIDIYQKLIS